eukprot:TRINITY_DN29563_c0_g1_i1.p1 TRINITY_DN29563_c0_g1~~TRINITY_DN29563_c0_g1_i1.p1  ORF type:complete len:246 (-),score=77.96 TRINITY_DN29563_c0_g1_i1:411-1070(-)
MATGAAAFSTGGTALLRRAPIAAASRMTMSSTSGVTAKDIANGASMEKLQRQSRIKDDMKNMLLEQAHIEMSASLAYLSMSYWFDREGMEGFRDFFRKQSDEERGHSIQFLDFLSKRGAVSAITPSKLLKDPETEFQTALHAMETYLALERFVADSINSKYSKAMDAKDWPTVSFLQPFVAYQIEEEDEADSMMEQVYRLTKSKDLTQVMDINLKSGGD